MKMLNSRKKFVSVLFGLMNLMFLVSVIVKVVFSMSVPILIYVVMLFLSEVYKQDFESKERQRNFSMIFAGIFILIAQALNGLIFKLPNVPLIFVAMVNFIVVASGFVVSRSERYIKIKEAYTAHSGVLNTLLNLSNKKPNTKVIQLCIDKEANEPELIKEKDRFLHMLILGPTGSGKTSQTIIPMINQDMQNMECGITVIEPKGDLAEKVYAMGVHYGREVLYFNPIDPDCPYFNPLQGKEEDVIEDMATTFKMLNPDSPQFFKDMNEQLLRKALLVLKRLMGNKANLIDLARLIQNTGGVGKKMVMEFSKIQPDTEAEAKENIDTASWFLNDYFNEKSKTYEHCSGLRSQVAKITSNKHLRRVLNPPNGVGDVDFVKHLKGNGVIAISTAQGSLRDLGRFLGYFIILSLQSAVFKRPKPEHSRRAHFLYIDEFQTYSNPGFGDMLTQGRSYRVASHLATQNRALMAMGGGRDGKNFVDLVSTNARHLVIYPGGNKEDANYYSEQFGEVVNKVKQVGESKQKFNLLYGFQKLTYPTEQTRYTEQKEAKFSPSDLIYRPFGEIVYLTIKDNSIQMPKVGVIEFIPSELNEKLDDMVVEYNQMQEKKRELLEDKSKDDTTTIFSSINPSDVPNTNNDVVISNVVKNASQGSRQVNTVIQSEDIDDDFDFIGEDTDSII